MRNLPKSLEKPVKQNQHFWHSHHHCSVEQNIISPPKKAKGTFLAALATITNYTSWQQQHTGVCFNRVHAALQMGSSLSSATHSWWSCKSGLQLECSGWLKSRAENRVIFTHSIRVCLAKKRHRHRTDAAQCRDGLSLITREQSPSPTPKETPSLLLTPQDAPRELLLVSYKQF